MLITNPFNDKVIKDISETNPEVIDDIIKQSFFAFKKNKNLSRHSRAEILENVSEILKRDKELFAKTIALESGKTINEARGEVARAVETFRLSSIAARTLAGKEIPINGAPTGSGKIGFYVHEPAGVVIGITPFNFPLNLVAHKVGPAIAAGNSIILKPSSLTPLTAIQLKKAFIEAQLPEGLFQIVIGKGESIGARLIEHPIPRIVTFTGSKKVGKGITKKAGLKKILLELGSNSAAVVLNDADLRHAVKRLRIGAFALAGQVCISVQRIYVQNEAFSSFIEEFKKETSLLKLGDPLNENTQMGPMISKNAINRVENLFKKHEKHAVLRGETKGNIIPPHIFIDVDENSPLIKEELFGPGVVVNRFEDLKDAIEHVNNSSFGLQAGIFTKDINLAMKFAKEVDTGGVLINDIPTFRVDLMPYGGVKESGLGREGPIYAALEMSEIKSIIINSRR